MVRKGYIWANEYMNLTSETHNMGELFVLKPQGNGSARGNHLAKRREVFNQYRIGRTRGLIHERNRQIPDRVGRPL